MDKEELKKLLDELPEEEHCDSIIVAASSRTLASINMLPDEDYIADVVTAAQPSTALALNELPDEDDLNRIIEASSADFSDDVRYPNEDYLDKVI